MQKLSNALEYKRSVHGVDDFHHFGKEAFYTNAEQTYGRSLYKELHNH